MFHVVSHGFSQPSVPKQHNTTAQRLLFRLPETKTAIEPGRQPATEKQAQRLRAPLPWPFFILLPETSLICALGSEPSVSPFDASCAPCPFLAIL
jgi:hypothetical protein